MKRVLIGGIGNVLLGDDGVGPHVARLISARYDFDPAVEVADLGTPALDLIDRLTANQAVILIDSVTAAIDGGQADPGTVVLYRKAELMRYSAVPAAPRMDPHSPALIDALLGAEFFGVAPDDVLLVGIVAESFEVGCDLSQLVHAAVEKAVDEVVRELDRLSIPYRIRQNAAEPGVWWATEAHSVDAPITPYRES